MSRQRGQYYESLSQAHLKKQGCKIISTNFSSRFGEVDIITQEANTLVFVEVRYRKSVNFGHALETITVRKQQRIITTAQYFLLKYPRYKHFPIRFDVITVDQNATIDWIKNAFGI